MFYYIVISTRYNIFLMKTTCLFYQGFFQIYFHFFLVKTSKYIYKERFNKKLEKKNLKF